MPGAVADQGEQASVHPIWEWVIVSALGVLVLVLSVVLSASLSRLLPQSDLSGGLVPPEVPMWEIALLCWGVSVPLALGAAMVVGRLVRDKDRGRRLWMRAALCVPVFCVIAAVLFWWLTQDPMTGPDSLDDAVGGAAWILAAWGLGVPAAVAGGFWLSAGRRIRVVQQAFRADSRELH